jgi:hypothetical protein
MSFGTVLDNARSNSVRENNCNTWLKLLDTRVTAAVDRPMVHVNADRRRALPPLLKP